LIHVNLFIRLSIVALLL